MSKNIVIIGNGIAGITCARHLRKRDVQCQITVISGESKYFFSRTALMYIYMGHMKFEHTKPYEDWFWEKNNIQLKQGWVTQLDAEKQSLYFENGEQLTYDKLVIASGSKPNKLGWPGQNLIGVQGLYSLQDLEAMESNTQKIKKAVIVGGGLIGVEMAEMLHSRGIEVTFLVREKSFWGNVLPLVDGNFLANHLVKDYDIDLRLNTELQAIHDEGTGRVKYITTSTGEKVECEFVGLTVGVSPKIEFLKSSSIKTKRGILVNRFFETNAPNVYAIGDCAEIENPPEGRKSIEQVWYTGRMMGELLAKNITSKQKEEYNPGPWFNSAKFFDIEYQTYGTVPTSILVEQNEFIWFDKSHRRMLHFVFEVPSNKFLGINAFGIRLRHAQFDAWLRTGKTIEFVLTNMADANFDPEFYKTFEVELLESFNQKFHTDLKPKSKSWKRILNPFSS